jgi:uncharacterized phiE125 gp8 family phage protein
MTSRILTSPAITESVTLAEAKAHCQVDPDFLDDDAYLTRLITVAREHTQERTRKLVAEANVEMYFDDLPMEVEFPWYPVDSLVSITYKDVNGQWQGIGTTGNGNVMLNKFRLPAKLILLNNPKTYKSVRTYSAENVVITFKAGFGSPSWPVVPERLKQIMLLLIRDMYDNRESTDTKQRYNVPMAAENLMADEAIYQFF